MTNDNLLASGSADKTIKFWDLGVNECVKTLEGHKDDVWSIVFFPNKKQLVSASLDGEIKTWNIKKNECIHTLDKLGFICCIISINENQLAIGCGVNIKIMDLSVNQFVCELQGHSGTIIALSVKNEDQLVSSSLDKTFRI